MTSIELSERYASALREFSGEPLDVLARRYASRKFGVAAKRGQPGLLYRVVVSKPRTPEPRAPRPSASLAEEMRMLRARVRISSMERRLSKNQL